MKILANSADEIRQLAEIAAKLLPLDSARLSDEYYYHSLTLCVIDAVFSIGVRYGSVQNVVERYCQNFGLLKYCSVRGAIPQRSEQESISTLCGHFEEVGVEAMTSIFENRQRTSARNGILKSEAVLRFAQVLRFYQIEHLQDFQRANISAALERDIRLIPGQKSGISFQYISMLAGSDEFVKPDRMILRFLENSLQRKVDVAEAQPLLFGIVKQLKELQPHITPRLLDHEIWKFQRAV
ncbi:hypothetical protein [Janthinobacterium sp. SUN120]|uniref:hypothetical protein n=1 Tax=Janthinobacterium sp. SUN120 TaxID=3004099 RepID=UPI0025B01715|nr:hypothetical protein [Janthinobacterium sp. SUN120]MDN2713712.1 hypothetical protein [Janthinobacterium sp. SUN120]